MADIHTKEQRHANMVAIKGKDTKPEVLVRRYLFSKGFRFKKNDKTLPGTPDIVLPKYRTVIFVNGCFWHGHKGCKYATIPQSNTKFWLDKITRNQKRDMETSRNLESLHWSVITIWECELKKEKRDNTLENLVETIRHNGGKDELMNNTDVCHLRR